MKIINPLEITEEDLPLIVLSDDRRGLLGFGIKFHTGGNYNHAMVMHRIGYFASQNMKGFREIPVQSYMKPFVVLKFWQFKECNAHQKLIFLHDVTNDLDAPWWRRRYDFLGIIGQTFHIPWLNNPWTNYCSERVAIIMRKHWKMQLPKHPSPTGINRFCNQEDKMVKLGYWIQD